MKRKVAKNRVVNTEERCLAGERFLIGILIYQLAVEHAVLLKFSVLYSTSNTNTQFIPPYQKSQHASDTSKQSPFIKTRQFFSLLI